MKSANMKSRITLKDIGEKCGVSKITVSYALRDDRTKVSAATIKKVKAAAVKLGYDPILAHAARRLRYQNDDSPVINQLIGVYFPFEAMIHRYWALIFRGMQHVLLRHGYGLLACTWDAAAGTFADQLPSIFRRGEVDGVVFYANEQNHREMVDGLRGEPYFGNRPIVAMGEPFPNCSAMLNDDFQAGYLQADHLLTLGHRHLLYFESRRLTNYTTQQRSRGMAQACLNHGLEPKTVLICED
ncbi:MAG: LacI family DNA-binding transcriptional regulator, partial [Planctomycetota bacterium]